MSTEKPLAPTRVLSVDALRGLVMFLMIAEVLELSRFANQFKEGDVWYDFWQTIGFHTRHVEWSGCSLHDLIQPIFSFLVGVSLPFSIANRTAAGQSKGGMFLHAVWRATLLILLGIFLRSIGRSQTNFMFTDTLGQIGLGYVFLFLLGLCWQRVQWAAFVVILVGYWALFALWPLPEPHFDYRTVGVSAYWRSQHAYPDDDFRAHWNKNTNPAMEVDEWLLNQFPRATPFTAEGGGYATLNFIPTLATMILGLIAGGWLRNPWSHWRTAAMFLIIGLAGLTLGEALDQFQVCPVVKRIWTPAWVLYSGGWAFIFLAVFYLIIEIIGFWHWAFPLLVLGANSIVAYCSNALFRRFIVDSMNTHLGKYFFRSLDPPRELTTVDVASMIGSSTSPMGEAPLLVSTMVPPSEFTWQPMLTGAAVLVILWLMLFWMYRNKIFVRI